MSQISEEVRARVREQANNAWINNGTHITGLTACGRATVLALQLNNPYAVTVRRAWISAG